MLRLAYIATSVTIMLQTKREASMRIFSGNGIACVIESTTASMIPGTAKRIMLRKYNITAMNFTVTVLKNRSINIFADMKSSPNDALVIIAKMTSGTVTSANVDIIR